MDFFNQAAAPFRDRLITLPTGSRVVVGVLAVLVVFSLGYLASSPFSAADAYLMGGERFSGGQIAAMEAAFAKADLADYQVEGNRIRVPAGQSASYMGALADGAALPPNFGSYLEKALAADGLFTSQRDKEERLKVAKQNELALILRSMQGIENASVIYDVQAGHGLNPHPIATASVNIKPLGSEPLDPARIPMIRSLVAAAIAGLKRESVTVTDLNGRAYPGGDEGSGEPAENPYYARKRHYERTLEQKIAESLVYVPGVVVKVNAELDPELRHVEETIKRAPHDTSSHETGGSHGDAYTALDKAGVSDHGPLIPSALGQSPADAAEAIAKGLLGGGQSGTKLPAPQYGSYDRIEREIQGLTPRQVKVLVAIPSSYYHQVWASRTKALEGQQPNLDELSRIEDDVKRDITSALGTFLPAISGAGGQQPQVTVTTFQSLPQPEPPLPSAAHDTVVWLKQHWAAAAVMLVVLMSLVMLRGMLRSQPVSGRLAQGQPAASPAEAESAESVAWLSEVQATLRPTEGRAARQSEAPVTPDMHAAHPAHAAPDQPTWKHDLSEMVRENPDTAAAILRNWIGKTT